MLLLIGHPRKDKSIVQGQKAGQPSHRPGVEGDWKWAEESQGFLICVSP